MLFDFVKSFLESLKSDGYCDIIDSNLCKGIIFVASNMPDEVLVAWYRDALAISDWMHVVVDSEFDYDADEAENEECCRFFYSALVDILAAMCFVRHIVLVPRLDS